MRHFIKNRLRIEFFLELDNLIKNQNKNIDELYFFKTYDFTRNPKNEIITAVKAELGKKYKLIIINNVISDTLSHLREQSRVEARYAEKNLKNLLAKVQFDLNKL